MLTPIESLRLATDRWPLIAAYTGTATFSTISRST